MDETLPELCVAQLVRDHHETLYRYAFRLTGKVADAEDLTQQTYLAAQRKIDHVRDAQCVRSWLLTILKNCYLKGFRQHLPVPVANLRIDLDSLPACTTDDKIDSERLQAALGQLPPDFKLVLLLFYFEQKSYREISEDLAIPIGTVMSRLSRAKSCLREKLIEPAGSRSLPIALGSPAHSGR